VEFFKEITIGKTYDVVRTSYLHLPNGEKVPDTYLIINDTKSKISYRVSLFKTLDEVRNEKLDELLK